MNLSAFWCKILVLGKVAAIGETQRFQLRIVDCSTRSISTSVVEMNQWIWSCCLSRYSFVWKEFIAIRYVIRLSPNWFGTRVERLVIAGSIWLRPLQVVFGYHLIWIWTGNDWSHRLSLPWTDYQKLQLLLSCLFFAKDWLWWGREDRGVVLILSPDLTLNQKVK